MVITEPGHKHSHPVNRDGWTLWNPGPCECGKTHAQAEADKALAEAAAAATAAYGSAAPVSTQWAVAFGPGGAYVELWDDEDDAREHAQFYDGGFVVHRQIVSLPWERAGEPSS